MRNRHSGETICLCATSSRCIKPRTPLAASHQDVAVVQKGWWQEKGRAPTARLAGVMPKLGEWEAPVCVGSSARLRLLLGVKAKGRRCLMCECWMEGFKIWKCWWGLGFYCGCGCAVAFITLDKSVASGDVVKAAYINCSSAQENREEWRDRSIQSRCWNVERREDTESVPRKFWSCIRSDKESF